MAECRGYIWDGVRSWHDRLPGCLVEVSGTAVNWNTFSGEGISDQQLPLCLCAHRTFWYSQTPAKNFQRSWGTAGPSEAWFFRLAHRLVVACFRSDLTPVQSELEALNTVFSTALANTDSSAGRRLAEFTGLGHSTGGHPGMMKAVVAALEATKLDCSPGSNLTLRSLQCGLFVPSHCPG